MDNVLIKSIDVTNVNNKDNNNNNDQSTSMTLAGKFDNFDISNTWDITHENQEFSFDAKSIHVPSPLNFNSGNKFSNKRYREKTKTSLKIMQKKSKRPGLENNS